MAEPDVVRPPIPPSAHHALRLPFQSVLQLLPRDDRPAILSTDGRAHLTFRALVRQSSTLQLGRFGIRHTDRIAVAIPNGPEAASALLAFIYGCTYAPLNPRLTHAELAYEFEDLPAKAVVVQRGDKEANNARIIEVARAMSLPILEIVASDTHAGAWELEWLERPLPPLRTAPSEEAPDPQRAGVVQATGAAACGAEASSARGEGRCRRKDVCLVLHTSGTSSKPKLVPLTHENLAVGACCIASALKLTRLDASLSVMPLFHIHGIAVSVLASLIAGAPVVAYHSFIPAAILDRVHRAKLARSDAHLTSNTANSMQAAQTSQAGGDTGVGHEDSEGAGADFSRIWYSAVPTMHLLLLEAAEAEARVAYRGLEHVSPVVTSDRGEDWDTHRTAIGTRVTPLAAKHCGPLHPSSIAPMPPDGGLLFIRNCSAALLPSIAARLEACLGCEVLPTYAMTESMPISANPRGGGRLLRSVGLSSGPEIRVVKPASSGSVPASAPSALDTSSGSQGVEQVGIVCALGEEGEVCVRGSCVTAGYELRPHMNADPNLTSFYSRLITVDGVAKLTSKISVSDDAFDKPGDGGATLSKEGVDAGSDESAYTEASGRWLRTGDKGMMASNGHLYLSGRFKEIINRAGEKISPFEVEDALRSELASNPYVKDLLAFSVPHRYLGEVVGVALALAPGTQPADRPTLRMLRSLGRRKLSLKWCPQVLVYFPSDGGTSMDSNRVGSPSGLPKGPTGKPARIALAERLSLPTIGGSPALTAPPEASAPAVDAGASQLSAALKSLSVEAPALRDAVDTWEVVGSAHGATGPIEARPCPPINSEPQPQRPSNGVDLDSSCGGPVRRRLEGSILQQLRVIWAEVLQLPTDAEDDMDDDVPFAAMGGDSLLGAMIIRAAHSRGILLHMSLAAEMEEHTLRSLAATMHQMDEVGTDTDGATAGWKDEEVSIWRDDSQASEVLPQIGHHEDRLLHSTFTAIVVAAPKSTPAAPRALRIIERDCRKPRSALTHVGGLTACAMGATVEAAALFASGKWDPIHAVDKHGNTSLMWASGAGHLHTVEWLLSGEVGVPIDAANKDGRTALMWACKNGQYEVVKNLIDVHGADSSLRMKDDSTAFDWAVLGGDVSTMELMVRQPSVDIHALNRFGCAAVQWAAAAGNVETCRWLLSKGFDLGHVNDARHGAVVKAAWKGHLSLLHWLLLDPGGPGLNWQLYMPDLEGRSVAELAVMNGQIEVADWLQKLVDERSRHEISG